MPRGGDMRKLATFSDVTLSADSYGDPAEVWTAVGSAQWVSIEYGKGEEFMSGRAVTNERPLTIRTRYRSDLAGLTPKARMAWNSRTFNLVSVTNIGERNRDLVILAREAL